MFIFKKKSEICVGDLSPQRCLFDGPGILKINNLSCAHYESEEIDSVYQSVLEELGGGIEADSLGHRGHFLLVYINLTKFYKVYLSPIVRSLI